MIREFESGTFSVLVLMGMKHCGKSSLGKLLSQKRSLPFHDLDEQILEAVPEYKPTGIRRLYTSLGRDAFIGLETEAARFLSENIPENGLSVVALGGGTIENRDALEFFRQKGVFIYLATVPEILYARILESGLPPFLSTEHPYDDFLKLYEKRTELFRNYADFTVTLDDLPLQEAFLKLENSIEELLNGR